MYTTNVGPRKDPRSLTNLPEILSCLSAFQSEEAELSNSLTHLLKAREPILSSLGRLQSISPQLDELQVDAKLLARKVSNTAETAERVGTRVRSLDEEMGRVREASDRVGQVMELKVNSMAFGVAVLTGTVLIVSLTRIYRKPRLGSCSKALCACHGLAIGGHIWSIRRGRRGPFRLRP